MPFGEATAAPTAPPVVNASTIAPITAVRFPLHRFGAVDTVGIGAVSASWGPGASRGVGGGFQTVTRARCAAPLC